MEYNLIIGLVWVVVAMMVSLLLALLAHSYERMRYYRALFSKEKKMRKQYWVAILEKQKKIVELRKAVNLLSDCMDLLKEYYESPDKEHKPASSDMQLLLKRYAPGGYTGKSEGGELFVHIDKQMQANLTKLESIKVSPCAVSDADKAVIAEAAADLVVPECPPHYKSVLETALKDLKNAKELIKVLETANMEYAELVAQGEKLQDEYAYYRYVVGKHNVRMQAFADSAILIKFRCSFLSHWVRDEAIKREKSASVPADTDDSLIRPAEQSKTSESSELKVSRG